MKLRNTAPNKEKYIDKWNNEGEGKGTQPGISLVRVWPHMPGQAEHLSSAVLQLMHTRCVHAVTARSGPQRRDGLWVISLNGKAYTQLGHSFLCYWVLQSSQRPHAEPSLVASREYHWLQHFKLSSNNPSGKSQPFLTPFLGTYMEGQTTLWEN